MNNPIPKHLHNPDFRFFLIGYNRKTPIEKRWNTDNCYMFFEKKLLSHIFKGGNVGICTGYGSLIVIDFDDADYQKQKEKLLPQTFTTRTAGKGLKHLYYYLHGPMISKIGIDTPLCDSKGNLNEPKRVADIQAGKFGIVSPPSRINRRYYSVINDRPIADIDCDTLKEVFDIKYFKESRRRKFNREVQPLKVQEAVDYFRKVGIERTNQRHFKCPFHFMNGDGNLFVFDDGSIHCFHCSRHYNSVEHFKADWEQIIGGVVIE